LNHEESQAQRNLLEDSPQDELVEAMPLVGDEEWMWKVH